MPVEPHTSRVGGLEIEWNRLMRWLVWTCVVLVVAMAATAASAHGIHAGEVEGLRLGGPLTYLWIGAVHMLTGYDHLLFLFGVMFFLTRFYDIVAFITAFTIGHSVTIVGATLLGIQASPYLVDAVIALSVIYKGFENLKGFERWIGVPAPSLLPVVGIFGLIHGFGLATRVLNYGLPADGLLLRLLSFNVGVELGQIAALACMFSVLLLLRRTSFFAPFTNIANGLLIAIGALLFLHQIHLYQHNTWPDDFGFSTSSHTLDHYTNDIRDGAIPTGPGIVEDKLTPQQKQP